MYLTLSETKRHLIIDDEFTLDDPLIIHLIEVAENAISKAIDRPLAACVQQDGTLPASIKHSILLMVANLYTNRESVSPVQLHSVPKSMDWLISLNRHYHIPR